MKKFVAIIDLNKRIEPQMKKFRCRYNKHYTMYIKQLEIRHKVIEIQQMRNDMGAQFSTLYLIYNKYENNDMIYTQFMIGL